jgi:hypothetical protein
MNAAGEQADFVVRPLSSGYGPLEEQMGNLEALRTLLQRTKEERAACEEGIKERTRAGDASPNGVSSLVFEKSRFELLGGKIRNLDQQILAAGDCLRHVLLELADAATNEQHTIRDEIETRVRCFLESEAPVIPELLPGLLRDAVAANARLRAATRRSDRLRMASAQAGLDMLLAECKDIVRHQPINTPARQAGST